MDKKSPHLLRAGTNVRRLKDNLVNVVDAEALSAIETAICANVAQLYALGRGHYNFAIRQNNRSWRQKISRLYYASYNVSRAIRLCVNGEYSTEVGDHKKIDILPDDFPNRIRYANRLGVLRDDRNMCDYDHTGRIGDLIIDVAEAVQLVEEFLNDTQNYLRGRGVNL
ncbi:MAG: hypothetical protein ABSH09_34495 [Bryobacteraceae bacterium]|jgi:hypothetical protein